MEGQGTNSFLSGENSPLDQHDEGARLDNVDLNAIYEDHSVNANQETDSASDPLLIGNGNEDCIHLSSKRRVELPRHLSIGDASSSNPQARNSEQLDFTAGDNVEYIYLNQPNETHTDDIGENEIINEDSIVVPSNEIHQATNEARQQQIHEQNVRQRTNEDFLPANLNWNALRAHDVHASDQQPATVFQNDEASYENVDPLSVAPPSQPLMVHQTRSFAQSLIAPADAQQQEVTLTTRPINVMLPPQPERQNHLNTANNMNYAYSETDMESYSRSQMPLNYQPVLAPSAVVPQIEAGVERLNYRQADDFFRPPLPEFLFERAIMVDELGQMVISEDYDVDHQVRFFDMAPLVLEEEIPDVQEGIGRFGTIITEGHILPHLRQQKCQPNQPGFPDQDENCCICQEQYIAGEDITDLQCGHYFHVSCITQWLVRKNSCPICKATGLVALMRGH